MQRAVGVEGRRRDADIGGELQQFALQRRAIEREVPAHDPGLAARPDLGRPRPLRADRRDDLADRRGADRLEHLAKARKFRRAAIVGKDLHVGVRLEQQSELGRKGVEVDPPVARRRDIDPPLAEAVGIDAARDQVSCSGRAHLAIGIGGARGLVGIDTSAPQPTILTNCRCCRATGLPVTSTGTRIIGAEKPRSASPDRSLKDRVIGDLA